MRLSERHREIIAQMEADGYVWLSHLTENAQMRFRNRTRAGFDKYIKIEGLTFLTKRVAEALSRGTKSPDQPRMNLTEQNQALEAELAELEKELYEARGVGADEQIRRFSK